MRKKFNLFLWKMTNLPEGCCFSHPHPSGRPLGADKSSRQAIRTLPTAWVPPHCKSRLRLMKAIRDLPTAWAPPYHKGRSGTKGAKHAP